jgi:hypothetical protein
VLDSLPHGLGLPPREVVGVVEVSEVGGGVRVVSASAARVARLVVGLTRLNAVLDVVKVAARVCRLHRHAERGVLELRHTPLQHELQNTFSFSETWRSLCNIMYNPVALFWI